ncbi:MAG: tRNA uridine-5-carboxymethylaminomethyl(34) synthesis enzyme MnmG [Candidatus Omnitrophica bacterium]|nr:tRNA uridine-5-carboxymethylaminomethyl(34) synthesis enzyme MnmG [Candidatus Omnitrophota bacterium]
MESYDVIVIGAGHAGIEAALASSRMGSTTLMLTLRQDSIGRMSCNPAIGGVGKAQLVREVDALGGQMGRAADCCGIQFRMLNASKGAAVQSLRAQVDMDLYARYMQEVVRQQDNLFVLEAEAKGFEARGGSLQAVVTDKGSFGCRAAVLCPGTFLDGKVHVGLQSFSAGRINEPAAQALAGNLALLGFRLLRFKTGTCPRLRRQSIDFSRLLVQEGDIRPRAFSFSTERLNTNQVPCHITHTNSQTHTIIRENLDRSPLYTGVIKSTGVRYCPSIEDKVVKFPDKERHQVFLEPQGHNTDEIYPNGLSTSLPEDVQLRFIRSIDGLEAAEVARFGYGIEHTVIDATQLDPTLEAKGVRNLFCAGQINGTTGYEEAAAQGLVAGVNASLRAKEKKLFVLDRSSSYTGVLIDDLTTKGTNEPYRMFTSRVEYRLILRQDNADLRLSRIGYELGLLGEAQYRRAAGKQEQLREAMRFLKDTRVKPGPKVNERLRQRHTAALRRGTTLEGLLKRPQVRFSDLRFFNEGIDVAAELEEQLELEIKYSGFIDRQRAEVERFRNLEKIRLPSEMDFRLVRGLSKEIQEKLERFRPVNLGQASRISGVTPAAVSLLMVYLKKYNAEQKT